MSKKRKTPPSLDQETDKIGQLTEEQARHKARLIQTELNHIYDVRKTVDEAEAKMRIFTHTCRDPDTVNEGKELVRVLSLPFESRMQHLEQLTARYSIRMHSLRSEKATSFLLEREAEMVRLLQETRGLIWNRRLEFGQLTRKHSKSYRLIRITTIGDHVGKFRKSPTEPDDPKDSKRVLSACIDRSTSLFTSPWCVLGRLEDSYGFGTLSVPLCSSRSNCPNVRSRKKECSLWHAHHPKKKCVDSLLYETTVQMVVPMMGELMGYIPLIELFTIIMEYFGCSHDGGDDDENVRKTCSSLEDSMT
jgi:hypothetical protein